MRLVSTVLRLLGRSDPERLVGGGSCHRLGPVFYQRIAAPGSGEFVRRLGLELGRASVYLHEMVAPDPGREFHNHRWKAAFLVLKGGYAERRAVAVPPGYPAHEGTMELSGHPFHVLYRELRPGAVNLLDQSTYHRVDRLLDGRSSWTLGVIWDRRPTWGFWRGHHVDSVEYHRELNTPGGFTPPSAPAQVSPARFGSEAHPGKMACVGCGDLKDPAQMHHHRRVCPKKPDHLRECPRLPSTGEIRACADGCPRRLWDAED